MSKRVPALLLVVVGALGLLVALPQAQAYVRAWVDLPSTNLATYTVTSTNQLISCTVPSRILVTTKTTDYPVTGNFFQCTNRYNAPVTLNWSIVSGAPANWGVSGSATLPADGITACRSVTFTQSGTFPNNTDWVVVFKGATDPTSAFYAEVQFSASVDLQNGNKNTGGCP